MTGLMMLSFSSCPILVFCRIEEDEEIEKDVSLADISRNSANEKCVIQ